MGRVVLLIQANQTRRSIMKRTIVDNNMKLTNKEQRVLRRHNYIKKAFNGCRYSDGELVGFDVWNQYHNSDKIKTTTWLDLDIYNEVFGK